MLRAVGTLLAERTLPRDEPFLTTRTVPANDGRDRRVPSLRDSMRKLGVDALNLTLTHWFALEGDVSPEEDLTALADAREQGLTRRPGARTSQPRT